MDSTQWTVMDSLQSDNALDEFEVVDETGFEEPDAQEPNSNPELEVPSDCEVVDQAGFEEPEAQDPVNATTPDQTIPTPLTTSPAVKTEEAGVPIGIDSHFHLDRSAKMLHLRNVTPDALIRTKVGKLPPFPVNIVGGVAIYCDPDNYPEVLLSAPGYKFGVGVHPRKVKDLTLQREDQLRSLLNHPSVAALGEIGLDLSEDKETWDLQEATFTRVLSYNQTWRPCVLHLRDPTDPHVGKLSSKCLQIMKENCAPNQKMHLHCFTGNINQVISWSQTFKFLLFWVHRIGQEFRQIPEGGSTNDSG